MKVYDIIERVVSLYNDRDYDRFSKRQYLKFLDDSINQLILSRPDAHVKHTVVQLAPGTQQVIPDEGYILIDIYMNKKAYIDGIPVDSNNQVDLEKMTYENYRPVFQVNRLDLDYYDNWQASAKNIGYDYINEFAHDTRSPRIYWVTPFVSHNTPVFIEMDYSYGCPKYGDMIYDTIDYIYDQEIPIAEIFKQPIISYFLYLLYSSDSTSVVDRQVAQSYLQEFYQALGLEYRSMNVVIPKTEDAEAAAAVREAS